MLGLWCTKVLNAGHENSQNTEENEKTGPAFKNYYIHMWETPHMVILSKYIICCLSICIECMFPKGKTISVYLI